MPTIANALNASLSQLIISAPQTSQNTAPGKRAAAANTTDADFRQALAIAEPATADLTQAVAVPVAPLAQDAASATLAAAPLVANDSGKSDKVLNTSGLAQASGNKRAKKAVQQKPSSTATAAPQPQQSAAISASAAWVVPVNTAPVAVLVSNSQAAPPQRPAASTVAASVVAADRAAPARPATQAAPLQNPVLPLVAPVPAETETAPGVIVASAPALPQNLASSPVAAFAVPTNITTPSATASGTGTAPLQHTPTQVISPAAAFAAPETAVSTPASISSTATPADMALRQPDATAVATAPNAIAENHIPQIEAGENLNSASPGLASPNTAPAAMQTELPAALPGVAAGVSPGVSPVVETGTNAAAAAPRVQAKIKDNPASIAAAPASTRQDAAAEPALPVDPISLAPMVLNSMAHAAVSRVPAKTADATGQTAASPSGAAQPAATAVSPGAQISVSTAMVAGTSQSASPREPAKPAEITRQIATALPAGSLAKIKAGTALHISLNPDTLGTITIKISQHPSGDTAVTITASQPETLAALKHDASNLNQLLTNAGVPEASRQLEFQTPPVIAPQTGGGLGSAGQQSGGQSAAGQYATSQQGQGNANGQPQQSGTAFANPASRATAPADTMAPRIFNRAQAGVNVIA